LSLSRKSGITLSIPLRKRKREWLEELLKNGTNVRQAEIVFKGFEYRLIKNKVVALDLGEIHLFVSFDGKEVLNWNGRLLRSYKQLRLKLIALNYLHHQQVE
jgi:transposase